MAIALQSQVITDQHFQDRFGNLSIGYSCDLTQPRLGENIKLHMETNGHLLRITPEITNKLGYITVGNGVNPPSAGLLWFHRAFFSPDDLISPTFFELNVVYHHQLCQRIGPEAPLQALNSLAFYSSPNDEQEILPTAQLVFGYRSWGEQSVAVLKSIGNDMKVCDLDIIIQRKGSKPETIQNPRGIYKLWLGVLNPMTASFFRSPTNAILDIIRKIQSDQARG